MLSWMMMMMMMMMVVVVVVVVVVGILFCNMWVWLKKCKFVSAMCLGILCRCIAVLKCQRPGNVSKFHVWYNTSTSCHVFSSILWFQPLLKCLPQHREDVQFDPCFQYLSTVSQPSVPFLTDMRNWRRAPWIFHSQGCVIYAVLCQMNRSDVSMSNSVSPNVSRLGV